MEELRDPPPPPAAAAAITGVCHQLSNAYLNSSNANALPSASSQVNTLPKAKSKTRSLV
jgi:hypothetical protein